MQTIYANRVMGVSELKANPAAALTAAESEPIAILNRNKPAGYLVSAEFFEAIATRLEDQDLLTIANARLNDGQAGVAVDIDEL
jgi:antitoxin StbD